ncbi:hypothetical protein [Candidatus Dactylopiibacterium carminicum]|nr:hypothetical protein [Candidatus Dactylopiibacterium carminicum]
MPRGDGGRQFEVDQRLGVVDGQRLVETDGFHEEAPWQSAGWGKRILRV